MRFLTLTTLLVAVLPACSQTAATARDVFTDPDVIGAMRRAWMKSKAGMIRQEAGFRLDGVAVSFQIVEMSLTNQIERLTMTVQPGETFAVFHVHPQRTYPEPSEGDIAIARKYNLRMYTISRSGLYCYDPATGRTSKLRDRLEWLDSVGPVQIAENRKR